MWRLNLLSHSLHDRIYKNCSCIKATHVTKLRKISDKKNPNMRYVHSCLQIDIDISFISLCNTSKQNMTSLIKSLSLFSYVHRYLQVLHLKVSSCRNSSQIYQKKSQLINLFWSDVQWILREVFLRN